MKLNNIQSKKNLYNIEDKNTNKLWPLSYNIRYKILNKNVRLLDKGNNVYWNYFWYLDNYNKTNLIYE